MNRTIKMLIVLATLAAAFHACKNDDTQTAPTGTGRVSGVVNDSASGAPLAGVTITAQTAGSGTQTLTTDPTGAYSFSFETDSSKSVTLTFTKSGYRTKIITTQVSSGYVTTLNIGMTASTPISGGTGSGLASSIFLANAAPLEISVYGVGGNETSYLTWEVRDSLGLPIDAAHAVPLTFAVTNGPGGGEFVSPPTATTNAQGRATIAFNSGVRSGVAQIVATTNATGRLISSTPVRIIIRAGLPDQAHFTIAPDFHNYAALHWVNVAMDIGVVVGDKYSNPVAEGTAIYFNSYAGVIGPSAFTLGGQGGVTLVSANPYPYGIYAAPAYGDGYHYVIARTVGENGVTVKDSTIMLWSGYSEIGDFSPTTINVPQLGSQAISFRVSDELGHPLAHGTTITVAGTGTPWPVDVYFGLAGSITLDDLITPGPGRTLFSFVVADAADTLALSSVNVQITVTGPNGSVYSTIGGVSH